MKSKAENSLSPMKTWLTQEGGIREPSHRASQALGKSLVLSELQMPTDYSRDVPRGLLGAKFSCLMIKLNKAAFSKASSSKQLSLQALEIVAFGSGCILTPWTM